MFVCVVLNIIYKKCNKSLIDLCSSHFTSCFFYYFKSFLSSFLIRLILSYIHKRLFSNHTYTFYIYIFPILAAERKNSVVSLGRTATTSVCSTDNDDQENGKEKPFMHFFRCFLIIISLVL